MGKILFWLAALALVWIGWRVLTAQRQARKGGQKGSQAGTTPEPVRMAQCAYCGVHFPSDDGVAGPDGRRYCGSAHRDAAGQR